MKCLLEVKEPLSLSCSRHDSRVPVVTSHASSFYSLTEKSSCTRLCCWSLVIQKIVYLRRHFQEWQVFPVVNITLDLAIELWGSLQLSLVSPTYVVIDISFTNYVRFPYFQDVKVMRVKVIFRETVDDDASLHSCSENKENFGRFSKYFFFWFFILHTILLIIPIPLFVVVMIMIWGSSPHDWRSMYF